MAAAAGIRSVARKMAPALPPHRVIASSGSGVGRSSPNPSRLSTSTGSSASGKEDIAARDQQVLGQVGDNLGGGPGFTKDTMDQIRATTNTCLAVLVFGGGLFYTFVKPKLKKLEDRANTLSIQVFDLKKEIIKLKNLKDEGLQAKVYEAQSMETSGNKST